MNTFGTRLGIIKQVLGLSYRDLLTRLEVELTERSLRNYIENKTNMTGDIISKVPDAFPEINEVWWFKGDGRILKEDMPRRISLENMVNEPNPLYEAAMKGENISVPAAELFKALFKDMKEINHMLESRIEYYETFISNMKF